MPLAMIEVTQLGIQSPEMCSGDWQRKVTTMEALTAILAPAAGGQSQITKMTRGLRATGRIDDNLLVSLGLE